MLSKIKKIVVSSKKVFWVTYLFDLSRCYNYGLEHKHAPTNLVFVLM